ncbi:hypothetical protein ACFSFZ_04815 [Mixta tenebrionis]|uniref:Uncharacterized protein n=1 Tax=Mixta tenebrionis TaxID=2562439 RepID=A0A506V7E0_9GAMM|nr:MULTISPECIES: hypothetical protein [Mixta]QHM76412.1 hypothetical protein C7M52_02388 [Mixta theicola]TPW41372.1 hypothetical protein FKM52_14065 [Mixta tenebrionis]
MAPFQQDEGRNRRYPVQEHMRWQRIEWRIQQIGYAVLIAIVTGGACGLFSKGFLSDRRAVAPQGDLQVEYERFARQQSDAAMTIRLRPPHSGSYRLTLSGDGVDNFQLQSIQPQPLRAESGEHSLTLWYQASNTARASIWLGGQPQSPGRYRFNVADSSGAQLQFTQWVYP